MPPVSHEQGAFFHRKFLPMNQNAPRGCAARGDEVYAEHTARARKCATSAHFILIDYCDEFSGTSIFSNAYSHA